MPLSDIVRKGILTLALGAGIGSLTLVVQQDKEWHSNRSEKLQRLYAVAGELSYFRGNALAADPDEEAAYFRLKNEYHTLKRNPLVCAEKRMHDAAEQQQGYLAFFGVLCLCAAKLLSDYWKGK